MGLQTINNQYDLNNAIETLQRKIAGKEMQVEANIAEIKSGLQPKNLLRNTFSSLVETPELKKILLNTAIGFAVGFLTKKTTEIINKSSATRFAENFINKQVNTLEEKFENNIIGNIVKFIRKYTPQNSPLFPFLKY